MFTGIVSEVGQVVALTKRNEKERKSLPAALFIICIHLFNSDYYGDRYMS